MNEKTCFNESCGTTLSPEWKIGWRIESGQLVTLCFKCGSAFERRTYCEEFHSNHSGWRCCCVCGKRLHCGCAASQSLIVLVENGGVKCIDCPNNVPLKSNLSDSSSNATVPSIYSGNNADFTKQLVCHNGGNGQPSDSKHADSNATVVPLEREKLSLLVGQVGSTSDSNSSNSKVNITERDERYVCDEGVANNIRGHHRVLVRNWPTITSEGLLQQISGVLSASDVNRIGRLIIPKACAEVYFPHITRPQGIPMKILDVNGVEWNLQYRYWPNHKSRMYVLEGVSPCLKSMHLEAGDTVLFSRIEPEGRFVICFRKQSKVAQQQDAGQACTHNDENQGEKTEENPTPVSSPVIKSKGKQHVCSKKRQVVENEDGLTLRTGDEVHEMLRPPPSGKRNVVIVDGHEFEEYEEPPVFGKDSVMTVHRRTLEQWTTCDSCLKWRRIPTDALLPPIWTCAENYWDPTRSLCSAPEELTPKQLKEILDQVNEPKKRRLYMDECSGLNVLADVATAEVDTVDDRVSSTISPTTKHHKHRHGCLCTVCIQPKNHASKCNCVVCMPMGPSAKVKVGRRKKHQPRQRKHKAALIHAEPPANTRRWYYQRKGNTEVKVKTSRNKNSLSNRRGKAMGQNGHQEEGNSRATASVAMCTQGAHALEQQANNKSSEQVGYDNGVTQLKQVKPSQTTNSLSNESGEAHDRIGTDLRELNALSHLALEQEQVTENHPTMQVELSEESAKILKLNPSAEVVVDRSVTQIEQLKLSNENGYSENSMAAINSAEEKARNALGHVTQQLQVKLSNESAENLDKTGHFEVEQDSKAGLIQANEKNDLQLEALTSFALEKPASITSEQVELSNPDDGSFAPDI